MDGKRLKDLRKRFGLSQQELADRIGCVNTLISMYEKGEKSPSEDNLIKMSNIFGVSTDYLLGLENKSCNDAYINKLVEELGSYSRVIKLSKDSDISPDMLEAQVKTLRKLLGKKD